MASSADIAQMLNLGGLDGSALADVISDYFTDRRSDEYNCGEEDILEAGKHYIPLSAISCMGPMAQLAYRLLTKYKHKIIM